MTAGAVRFEHGDIGVSGIETTTAMEQVRPGS
jgi:hypothetical protein